MLILTRKKSEQIVLDLSELLQEVAAGRLRPQDVPPLRVTFLGLRGEAVRIGTEAPNLVEIHRQEVFQRIQRERKVA